MGMEIRRQVNKALFVQTNWNIEIER